MTAALVLPEPDAITPAQIPAICHAVEAEALATDDAEIVAEMHARWSAVTQYLAIKSRDGIAQARATELRLLARIGELSPPAPRGPAPAGRVSTGTGNNSLPPNRLTEARHLAANRDVVEDVIAESTDEAPPSKAQVLNRIRERAPRPPLTEEQQRERDINEAIGRARAGLEMLVIGWIELVALPNSAWRDQILAGLIDQDRDRVTQIESIYLNWKAAHA